MRILTGADIYQKNFPGSVVTIGNFDGVHRGHVALLRHLMRQSERLSLPGVVVTFEPHPLALLTPELAPTLITTFDQKCALIAEQGVDCLVVIGFTHEFSLLAADAFVRDVLCRCLGMRHIIIGHDYAFGRDRQGNCETLARMGGECGFTLEELDPVGSGELVYSSSLVRRMVSEGDVSTAAAILGRYHVVTGRVVHGRRVGRELGFPTANIAPFNELIPQDGVYAVMVALGDRLYQGACNIGVNPTLGDGQRSIEVFLLDFSGELYEREISLCFVRRLRGERKFPDAETLIRAIEQDVQVTREILATVDREWVKPLSGAARGENRP